MKKQFMAILTVGLFMMPSPAVIDAEEVPELAPEAESAILMEKDTGEILYEKQSHKQLRPASMTKLMTLLLIMEALEDDKMNLDEKVRISENAASMGGSQVFLEAGEEMRVEDLLKAVAIASGNDASVALAERVAGSEEAFIQEMNEKAEALDLENTHFSNTTGLPAKNHYSTALDLATIAKHLLAYEEITDYTSIYDDYLRQGEDNEFWLVNTNNLVKHYEGVDGLKTGHTSKAKFGLTATAEKNDMRVIAVTMGAEDKKERNRATSSMLDYAFQHYQTEQLYRKGDAITSLELLKADKRNVDVVTKDDVSVLMPIGETAEDVSTEHVLDEHIKAPIQKGEQVGKLVIRKENKAVSEVPLIVTENVGQASFFKLWKRSISEIVKGH